MGRSSPHPHPQRLLAVMHRPLGSCKEKVRINKKTLRRIMNEEESSERVQHIFGCQRTWSGKWIYPVLDACSVHSCLMASPGWLIITRDKLPPWGFTGPALQSSMAPIMRLTCIDEDQMFQKAWINRLHGEIRCLASCSKQIHALSNLHII